MCLFIEYPVLLTLERAKTDWNCFVGGGSYGLIELVGKTGIPRNTAESVLTILYQLFL